MMNLTSYYKPIKVVTTIYIDRDETRNNHTWTSTVKTSPYTNEPKCIPGKRKKTNPPVQKPVVKHQRLCRTNYFDMLPDEVLKHIFKFVRQRNLKLIMKTCTRFERVANDRDLWTTVDYHNRKVHEFHILQDVLRGSKVLSAGHSSSLAPLTKYLALPKLRLEHLDLTNASMSKLFMKTLLRACNSLRKLSIESHELDFEMCALIAENRNLDTLNLCMTTGLTVCGIDRILVKCTQLVEVNVAWTSMNTECMSRLAQGLPPTLRRLNIDGYTGSLHNRHIEFICIRCPKIQHLSVADNNSLTGPSLSIIGRRLLELQTFEFSRCYNLMLPELMDYISALPKLEYISLLGIPGDEYMRDMKERLPNIKVNHPSAEDLSCIARPKPTKSRVLWGVPLR